MTNDKIRVADLFGGVGGFRLGFQQASDKYEFVWYCDKDKWATQVYNKRFGENYEPTNIREVNPKEIPDFDILCSGFPCQPFSISGKRGGFEDTRGTLFFEVARIAKTKKPKVILLENVKGLLNHKKGKTFITILQTLRQLGYRDIQWTVLNSKYFGVPQNRERVFIIGYLGEGRRRKVLPIREDAKEIQGIYGEETEKKQSMIMNLQSRSKNRPAIRKRIEKGLKPNAGSGTIGKEDEAYSLDTSCTQGVARCLDANMHKGVTPKGYFDKKRRNIVAVTEKRTDNAKKIRREYRKKTGKDWCPRGEKKLVPRNDDKANCITASTSKEHYVYYDKLRRLTPVECEKLQGFPTNWTKVNCKELGYDRDMSDTKRYQQMGNTVTVNVIQFIANQLIKNI
jgi:DNA (cytosine-5)-methyltransferase 1